MLTLITYTVQPAAPTGWTLYVCVGGEDVGEFEHKTWQDAWSHGQRIQEATEGELRKLLSSKPTR